MRKKKCELCPCVARIYCESDQANLCWKCDLKVHGANFLVARHKRCLLCSVCQSHTLWEASGLRLGPTVCLCVSCLVSKKRSVAGRNRNPNQEIIVISFNGADRLTREDDGAESYNENEVEDKEEAENQIVPAVTTTQKLPAVSSSSSVCCEVAKRTRDHNSDEEIGDSARPRKPKFKDEALNRNSKMKL